jgi:hypothetical protein
MKRRVYIETSIVSYLAGRPSRDVIVAGRQQLTHTWWEVRRPVFDLVISQVVLNEVRAGDPEAAQRRLAFLADVPSLDVTTEAAELAALLIERVPLPTQAAADATSRSRTTWTSHETSHEAIRVVSAQLRRRGLADPGGDLPDPPGRPRSE